MFFSKKIASFVKLEIESRRRRRRKNNFWLE
jgi:hypothetical protein